MKISQLIKRLEEIKEKEGDLECFDINLFEGPFLNVDYSEFYDESLNLPKKFLTIGENE